MLAIGVYAALLVQMYASVDAFIIIPAALILSIILMNF